MTLVQTMFKRCLGDGGGVQEGVGRAFYFGFI